MCMYSTRNATRKLKSKITRGGGTIDVFKFYHKRENGSLQSPFKSWRRGSIIKAPRVILSDRPASLCSDQIIFGYGPISLPVRINQGIHVYLLRSMANRASRDNLNVVVVKLKAKVEDLVAAGVFGDLSVSGTAVFTKVELTKQEWKKVFPSAQEKAIISKPRKVIRK